MKLKTKVEPPPENRRLGYARVSTYGQTLDAQLEQLRAERCGRIYREKVTGAHNDRRELLKMLKHLAPGDVVTVTRIDRLARSTFDLFAISSRLWTRRRISVRSRNRGPIPAPAPGA
jgi:DNA invertase Pin-like site-specific DNA recombinase